MSINVLKSHLIPFYSFRDMLRTSFLLQKIRSNSVNIGDRVMVLDSVISFIALYHCIKFHSFSFNTFRDMLRTSLL